MISTDGLYLCSNQQNGKPIVALVWDSASRWRQQRSQHPIIDLHPRLRAQAACDLPLNTPEWGGGFGGKEKLTACEPTGFSLAAAFAQNTSHPDSRLSPPPQRFLELGNLSDHVKVTPITTPPPSVNCHLNVGCLLCVRCQFACIFLFLVQSNFEYFFNFHPPLPFHMDDMQFL